MVAKHYDAPSVFTPQSLLREARRQKAVPPGDVPGVCILDPDGDIVAYLAECGLLSPCETWACYHTSMHRFQEGGREFGIIARAVGSAFSVLVAEQLFASGCALLVSVTSAGDIARQRRQAPFMLITSALRDEGTSVHYLPPAPTVALDADLQARLAPVLEGAGVASGTSWTTDAPFRETRAAVEEARRLGAVAVEMEAAALYAFARSRGKRVVCLAHITNSMGQSEGDFEKGEANGSIAALRVIGAVASAVAVP